MLQERAACSTSPSSGARPNKAVSAAAAACEARASAHQGTCLSRPSCGPGGGQVMNQPSTGREPAHGRGVSPSETLVQPRQRQRAGLLGQPSARGPSKHRQPTWADQASGLPLVRSPNRSWSRPGIQGWQLYPRMRVFANFKPDGCWCGSNIPPVECGCGFEIPPAGGPAPSANKETLAQRTYVSLGPTILTIK